MLNYNFFLFVDSLFRDFLANLSQLICFVALSLDYVFLFKFELLMAILKLNFAFALLFKNEKTNVAASLVALTLCFGQLSLATICFLHGI